MVQVQRLQRFATYGYLKQVVLKMIAADLAEGATSDMLNDDQSEAISMVTALRYRIPLLSFISDAAFLGRLAMFWVVVFPMNLNLIN